MKLHLTAAAIALAFAGSAFAANPATSGSINPGQPSDNSTNSTYTAGTAGTASVTIDKYTGGGVLIGASFSTVFAAESVSWSRSNCTFSCGTATGNAYGAGTIDISVPGPNIQGSGSSATISSGTIGSSGATGTIASYTINASATSQGQLDALYGSGTVSGTVGETLNVNRTGGNYSVRIDNSANRTAEVTTTYTAVNHATGGLSLLGGGSTSNTLNLSFGNVTAGTTPASVGFDLYNLVGSYGLQIKDISYQGGGSPLFSLGGIGTGTTNLAAGSSVTGNVGFAGSATAGAYSGTWLITVADSATGIGAGKNTTNTGVLTLNVNANVVPVPEPESYAMLLAGLGMMGFIARRRRQQST